MSEEVEGVLKRFCVAMYILDIACYPLKKMGHAWSGREADVYKFDLLIELQREWVRGVFQMFCVATESPERDYGVGSDPPGYHPDYFDVVEIKVNGKKATAKVRQPSLSRMVPSKGGGIVVMNDKHYIYHLRLTPEGWRLEDRREAVFEDGEIIEMGL